MSEELIKKKIDKAALDQSIENYAFTSVSQNLDRAKSIMRDKMRVVNSFFDFIQKEPEEITTKDVRRWYDQLTARNLSENYIYTCMSHLSGYFEYLRSLPELSHFIKVNPVRAVMPKAPKKYNSPKAKSLTDSELSKLWLYLQREAESGDNLVAVRDYAILRLFMATGMRREEILSLGAADIKFEEEFLLIHSKVKGGHYEWRTIADRDVREALERYLRLSKRKSIIGKKGMALWIRFDRGAFAAMLDWKAAEGEPDEPRLSSHAFDKQIKRYASLAGIGEFNIHKFRHTFARIVSEDSGSIIETQDALGHKDLQTTQVYVNSIRFKKDKFSRNISSRIKPEEETM